MLIRADGSILFETRDGCICQAEFSSIRFGVGEWEVREVDCIETGSVIYPPACRSCGFNEPVCRDGYCRDCHTDGQAGCLSTLGC
jgi:hypothetical protein